MTESLFFHLDVSVSDVLGHHPPIGPALQTWHRSLLAFESTLNELQSFRFQIRKEKKMQEFAFLSAGSQQGST